MRDLTPKELIYVSGGLQIQLGGGGITAGGVAGSATGTSTLGSTTGNFNASSGSANGVRISVHVRSS